MHWGTCSREAPQSSLFPINDLDVMFVKGPFVGISPSSLLKVKFIYLSYLSLSRDLGIAHERLLLDKSKDSMLIKFPNDSGQGPLICYLL